MAQHLARRMRTVWGSLPAVLRIGILAASVFVVWVVLVGHTFNNTPVFGYIRGGTADWLVANEAWSDGTPYAPLDQLAEQQLGWTDMEPKEPHPRPPSALLMLGPLALAPSHTVIIALAVANALALTLWVVAAVRWSGLEQWAEFSVLPLAVVAPSLNSTVWGSHIPIMAAALGLAFLKRGPVWRGTGIALAAGFKLFPFLLALVGKANRMRNLMIAGSVFGGLVVFGLLLPGVHPEDALSALINAPDSYGTSDVNVTLNGIAGGSLGSVIFPVLGVGLVLVMSKFMSEDGAMAFGLLAMVLFAPYAWPEYMILWFPALLFAWQSTKPAKLAVLTLLIAVAMTKQGSLLALAGLLLACTLAYSDIRGQRRAPLETDRTYSDVSIQSRT